MKITIFGSGYVGLVTGACFSSVGHQVTCVDIDAQKIERLRQGDVPIYEPGLDNLITTGMQEQRLQFTTDAQQAIEWAQIIFIAVGTPPDEDGTADLQYVLAVTDSIGQYINGYKVVVDKSTVPVGTADKVRAQLQKSMQQHGHQHDFDVVSNPEFLKEGAAIGDFMKPDRIVIGTDSTRAADMMEELYAPFNRNRDRLITMDVRSAELTKYAANAMLATKIIFMNEMALLAEKVGADIEKVRIGIGSDPRIGYHFIYPGCGYGGSCFPKDVKAIERTAREVGFDAHLLAAVEQVNNHQKTVLFDKINHYFEGDLSGKTIALWGLAFKPKTDDMREAPSRVLLEALWQAGARVQVYDPVAREEAQRLFGQRDDLKYCDTPEATTEGADALAIVTEWAHFRAPDFEQLRQNLSAAVIFDGRNMYNPETVTKYGLQYIAIGRPVAGKSTVNTAAA